MPNWIQVLASAVGHRGGPPHQKPAQAESQPWQNEAVMSPLMRQRIQLIARIWLGWTIAGLFYIIQETVPRLYRGGAVPWKYVFVDWMTGMYVCGALTPALLWLGNRWPIERRVTYAALHLCFSVVFSILATVIEVPILLLLGVFPAPPPSPSIVVGVRIMLSFGIQGGVIRYWAVIALHAVYRSQKNAKTREREAFGLKVQASELAQQLATESRHNSSQRGANLSCANDSNRLAEHVKADETIQIEVAVTHAIVGAVNISIERQHQRDGVLGDGVRRIGGDAEHGQAKLGCGGKIDVVIAGAPQGNKSSAAGRQR